MDAKKLESVLAALESGTSKAAVCCAFGIPRSTLADALVRAGWMGPGSHMEPRRSL
jgi:transposase-like protein